MTPTFLDTSILIYATLQTDRRSDKARAALARRGVVSVQVLSEFASVARRKLRQPWPAVRTALAAIRTLCAAPVPLTTALHEQALDLAEQHGFALYNALIVAAALEAGCATLLTGDLQHGQIIDGRLRIENPFA